MFNSTVVEIVMIVFEVIFCIWLMLENKSLNKVGELNSLHK